MTLAVLWTRAALLTRRRVGLPQGGPEAEGTIGDDDRRRDREPTVLEVEEQLEPARLALTEAVDDGDQFLPAVGHRSHEHEQALLRIGRVFQADAHVDPVRPDVDVLLAGEVAWGMRGRIRWLLALCRIRPGHLIVGSSFEESS